MIIVKGNKPLEPVHHPKLRTVFYASSAKYLPVALADPPGWERWPFKPMTISLLTCSNLAEPRRIPLDFVAQAAATVRKGAVSI